MQDSVDKILNTFTDKSIAIIFLGIFGGFVRMLNDKDISYRKFLGGLCTSGFVSILISLALADFEMPFSMKGFFIGIAGYSGTAALDVLARFFLKRLHKLADEKDKAEEESDDKNKS